MKTKIVCAWLLILGLLPLNAANPAFQDFNTNQFGTTGNKVSVKSGALMTNAVLAGSPNTGNLLATSSNPLYPLMVENPDGSGGNRQILYNPNFVITGTNAQLSGNMSGSGADLTNSFKYRSGASTGFALRSADATGAAEWSTNFNELNVTNLTIVNNVTVKNGGTLNLAGGSLSGDAYVMVGGSSVTLTNGQNLTLAYTAAKLKTPHGAALSANNRYTIYLLPGVYDMGSGSLALDAQFIDLVGWSLNTGDTVIANTLVSQGDTIITSSGTPININVASHDITLANLCLRTTTGGSDSCIGTTQTGFGAELKVINVLLAYAGSGNRITPWDKNFSGYWQDVRAMDVSGSTSSRAFGASVAGGVTVAGLWIRCKAEASAWGGENNVSVALSGTFIDNEAGAGSFCGGGAGGTKTLSGTFLRNRNVVSAGAFMGGADGTMSGYFEGNVGDVSFNNFGGGTMSGTMTGNSGTAAISWTSVTGKLSGNNFPGFTDNSFASRAVDAAVNIAASGWTNTYAKNATVYIDGTGVTFTVYNSAGTAIYTNAATVAHAKVDLQPAGKVIVTAGTGVTGRATPL